MTSIEGRTLKFSDSVDQFKIVKNQTPLYNNEVVTTNSNGITVIDFNDEVIGTVVLAPNTQVILRKSNTDGIRLLSLVRGHLRLYRGKQYDKKKVGVIINIRDNPTAYHGTNFEVQYLKESKKVTSFNDSLRKLTLKKNEVEKKQLIVPNKADILDQELLEDLKFLKEST